MSQPNIFPALRYRDPDAALAFLRDAFGFTEKAAHRGDNGQIQHAEMQLDGGGIVMFGAGEPGGAAIYAIVADVDAHHERAAAAGAKITEAPVDRDYGAREYGAEDSEGHAWYFGTYDPYAEG